MNLIVNKFKNYFKYTFFHYLILRFTNPNYIKWLQKEYLFHKKFLCNENLIFDLGANHGDKTYIFNKFSKKVVCFEPESKMFFILKNRFNRKKIILKKKIISNKIENSKFLVVRGNEAYSTINKKSLDQFNHINKKNIITKIVRSSTLNNEIQLLGIPDYIKIDCEGAEKKILYNLKHKIRIISFELNLPYFYKDGKTIIKYFTKTFNSKFNIRVQDSFVFKFKKNINGDKCTNFLKNKKSSVEIFVFN